jgi:hypothetical protein
MAAAILSTLPKESVALSVASRGRDGTDKDSTNQETGVLL